MTNRWCCSTCGFLDERDKALQDIVKAIDGSANRNGPDNPTRCPCEAVLKNPGDIETMRVHAPHVQAKSRPAQD